MTSVESLWEQHLERLGGYIKAQRQFSQLSQRQLAEMSQLSDTYMSQLERGRHEPSLRVLRSLADSLGVSTAEMIRRATGIDMEAESPTATEEAVRNDPRFTDAQKRALLSIVESFTDG